MNTNNAINKLISTIRIKSIYAVTPQTLIDVCEDNNCLSLIGYVKSQVAEYFENNGEDYQVQHVISLN